ncbi:hypothetical protein DFH09DRAFT_1304416 [Mycena vulgaris]|nr:hypothetical protein DFH09DRAFT_1304416 [Mycena vulgaris]
MSFISNSENFTLGEGVYNNIHNNFIHNIFYGKKRHREAIKDAPDMLSLEEPTRKRCRREEEFHQVIRKKHLKLTPELGSGPGYSLHAGEAKGRAVIVKVFNAGPTVREQLESPVALSEGFISISNRMAALALILLLAAVALAARLVSSTWLPFLARHSASAEALPTSTRAHTRSFPSIPRPGPGTRPGEGRHAKSLGPVLPRFRVDADVDAQPLLDLSLSLSRSSTSTSSASGSHARHPSAPVVDVSHPPNEGEVVLDMGMGMDSIEMELLPSPSPRPPPATPHSTTTNPVPTIDAMNAMNRALSPPRLPRTRSHLPSPLLSPPPLARLFPSPPAARHTPPFDRPYSAPPVHAKALAHPLHAKARTDAAADDWNPLHVAQHRVEPAAPFPFAFALARSGEREAVDVPVDGALAFLAAAALKIDVDAAPAPSAFLPLDKAALPLVDVELVDLAAHADLGADVDVDGDDAPGYPFPFPIPVPVPARAFDAHAHSERAEDEEHDADADTPGYPFLASSPSPYLSPRYALGELEAQAEVGEEEAQAEVGAAEEEKGEDVEEEELPSARAIDAVMGGCIYTARRLSPSLFFELPSARAIDAVVGGIHAGAPSWDYELQTEEEGAEEAPGCPVPAAVLALDAHAHGEQAGELEAQEETEEEQELGARDRCCGGGMHGHAAVLPSSAPPDAFAFGEDLARGGGADVWDVERVPAYERGEQEQAQVEQEQETEEEDGEGQVEDGFERVEDGMYAPPPSVLFAATEFAVTETEAALTSAAENAEDENEEGSGDEGGNGFSERAGLRDGERVRGPAPAFLPSVVLAASALAEARRLPFFPSPTRTRAHTRLYPSPRRERKRRDAK